MSSDDSTKKKFGHVRRREKRQADRKRAIQQSRDICQDFIDDLAKEHADFQASDERINQLYADIFEAIKSQISATYLPFALFERKRFFERINRQRSYQGLDSLPLPVIASRVARPKNTNDFDQFLYLSHAQNVVKDAIKIWQQKNKFSLTDSISWLLFSLVSFGGYNNHQILTAVYHYLKEQRPIYRLGKEMLCLPIKLESEDYANEVIRETQFYRTRLVFIDDISRLWLLHLQRQLKQDVSLPKLHQVMRRLGEFTQDGFTVNSIKNSTYLENIPIFWQTLPNVRLDVQLVEMLSDNQKHTAVTTEHWLRYFQAVKLPKVNLQDDHFSRLIIKANSNDLAKNLGSQIFKSDIVKDIRQILNGDNRSINASLNALLKQPLFPNQRRLVSWMIRLYVDGNKTSTLKRYLSEIGNAFIANTREADFIGWTKHDYHYIYEEILSEKTEHKKGYTTTVLCSLHQTLKKQYLAPDIDLRGGGDPQIIASYLIPSLLYSTLQTRIAEQEQLSDYNKHLLQVVLSLLYRTGMRISEILGLQVKDIEYDNQGFSEYNLIVRSNAHRSLKSDDGTRRICLSTLLLTDELERFKTFFRKKQEQSSRYLFTLAYQAQPLSWHSIEQPLKALLADTPYQDITLHAFRHNAISNMAVILRSHSTLAQTFTDYDADQIKAIKHHFLGTMRTVSTNYWDALMEFAGHADLNTTFASYIHTADVIASHQLSQADLTLPLDIVNELVSTSRASLHQHNKQAYDANNNVVNVKEIRVFINNKIDSEQLYNVKPSTSAKESNESNERRENATKSAVFGQYSREMIEKLLFDIEEGQSLSQASQLNFEYEDALKIYTQALELVTNEEGISNHKLIHKNRKQKSEHILIAPTPLNYHAEKALANLCFDNLETLYQSKTTKNDVREMLDVFYKKTNTSKSDIRFPFKERTLFYRYLKIMFQILPSEHWQVNICAKKSKTYHDENGKQVTEFYVDKKAQIEKVEYFKKAHPNFAGKIITKDIYSGYALSVMSPVKELRNKKGGYSSALMQYVLHFMLVVEGLG